MDVILPRRTHLGSLSRDLGVSLARRAIRDFGIARVRFLSVVQLSELESRIIQLRAELQPPAEVRHCDKAVLLERDLISEIIEFFAVATAFQQGFAQTASLGRRP